MRKQNNFGILTLWSFIAGAVAFVVLPSLADAGISSVLPASALVSSKEIKKTTPKVPASTAPVKAQPSLADISAAKATLTTTDTYHYTSVGKTDPFKPFMELEPKPVKLKEKAIPLSPLQRLDVDQYTLVGIAGNNKSRAAMVEDRKDKKFYPLFVGTSIGQNHGRVIEILADRVVVEEKLGNEKAKRIVLLLHREEEVKP
jgi:Tfp pilus assembly protein PilP